MRGTTHLIVSTVLAAWLAGWLFAPIMSSFEGVAMVAVFIWFAAIGSIAPDADIKKSLIRRLIFLPFFLPYWLLALAPLSFVFDFRGEPLLTRVNRSLFHPHHRGVMHSLPGWIWSVIVVYIVTAHLASHYPAMAAAEGFAIGYLLHLIEDAIFTKTSIRWLGLRKAGS